MVQNILQNLISILGNYLEGFYKPVVVSQILQIFNWIYFSNSTSQTRHVIFDTILPLLSDSFFPFYYEHFSQLISDILEENSFHSSKIIFSIFKFWANQRSHKQIMFLHLLFISLHALYPKNFKAYEKNCCIILGKCFKSENEKLIEAAMCFANHHDILLFIHSPPDCLFPLIDGLLVSLNHKNPHIQFQARQCIANMKTINSKLVNQIIQDCQIKSSQDSNKCLTWLTIYKSVPKGDLPISQNFIRDLSLLSKESSFVTNLNL
jgi:hypothetical protein